MNWSCLVYAYTSTEFGLRRSAFRNEKFVGDASAKMRITYFLTFLTFSRLFCHFLTYFPTYISYVPKINKSLN